MAYTLEELKAKQATGEIPAGTQITSSSGASGVAGGAGGVVFIGYHYLTALGTVGKIYKFVL